MKIGIFGSRQDQQCKAMESVLRKKGADVVLVESQGLNQGHAFTFDNGCYSYRGVSLDDVGGWYMRYIMSPLPPWFASDENFYLYGDWYHQYMNRRERFGFQLSFLLAQELRGIPMLNPPAFGSVVQQKPYQLAVAQKHGIPIPETLISNDPQQVRAMAQRVDNVVYKPSMGGGLCEPLDAKALQRLDSLVEAPVTFQERVDGLSIRATIVGEELVSCVGIASPNLDYRSDDAYQGGQQQYSQEELPPELLEQTRQLMKSCGLLFSGVDFIRRDDGQHIFLEANSSPIYLDIERKTGVPITDKMASYLLQLANEPQWYRQSEEHTSRSSHFLSYSLPFAPSQSV